MMRCPRCSELLGRKRVAGVELDGCHACGGAFFDPGELTTLARDPKNLLDVHAAFPVTAKALQPTSTNACPRCAVPMVKFEQPSLPGIELDACKTCKGIWLDGGEAAEIAQRRGAIPAQPTPTPPVARPEPPAPAPAPIAAQSGPNRVALFATLALTFLGCIIASGHALRLKVREHATGHITNIVDTGYGRYRKRYALVNFTAEGRPYTVRRSIDRFDFLRTGDDVGLYYTREDPEGAALGTFWSLWSLPIFILIIGGIIAAKFAGIELR